MIAFALFLVLYSIHLNIGVLYYSIKYPLSFCSTLRYILCSFLAFMFN